MFVFGIWSHASKDAYTLLDINVHGHNVCVELNVALLIMMAEMRVAS